MNRNLIILVIAAAAGVAVWILAREKQPTILPGFEPWFEPGGEQVFAPVEIELARGDLPPEGLAGLRGPA